MDEREQYLGLLSEIIAKQSVILGPDIAVLKARAVPELTIAGDGRVTAIQGDPRQALEKLVDEYVALSGLIIKSAISSVFTKYPQIKRV